MSSIAGDQMIKQAFQAELSHLHAMLAFIRSFAANIPIPPHFIDEIILASEEALINIIEHGYQHAPGAVEITCEESTTKPGIKITFQDQGIPFNPLGEANHHPPPHVDQDLPNRKPGGYGITIYSKIMDSVEYQPLLGGGNRLILIKYCHRDAM